MEFCIIGRSHTEAFVLDWVPLSRLIDIMSLRPGLFSSGWMDLSRNIISSTDPFLHHNTVNLAQALKSHSHILASYSSPA